MVNLRQLTVKELESLCSEIRENIIGVVNKNGGHLASNLGVVELTVALCYVFDFDLDKIVFDVGHQAYAYKYLTDRADRFSTIRAEDGLSGFPDPEESDYDVFSTGHAGTSIAVGLGLAYARDKVKDDYFVISLVGDASFFNGENLEAISASDSKPKKFLVILNDNGKSISKNNNGLYKAVSAYTTKKSYIRVNNFFSKTIAKCFIGKALRGIKNFLKRSMSYLTILDKLDLKYVGPFDGHDLKKLIKILRRIKESENPTLLHVRTTKGKGYALAEDDSTKYHGIGKNLQQSDNSFSDGVGGILERLLERHPDICAITAGMKNGVGLSGFGDRHPDSFLDVGIAEDLAVTVAGGMAKGGSNPIVFIYSTFLQRAFDQILNDICLQNLHVVFCIDRAGFVGNDGKTHQGIYDLTYLIHLPNITVLAPRSVSEFESMLAVALDMEGPVAVRYPTGVCESGESAKPFDSGLEWETLEEGDGTCIFAVGSRMLDVALKARERSGKNAAVVNARCIKPLDERALLKYREHRIITLEENVISGGFGESVLAYYSQNGIWANVKIMGAVNGVVGHASVASQLEKSGLTVDNLTEIINGTGD
ncbi:MAG: 1-deoxy-D-xylulose-5-phosphate synthase [Roseburia sp.]|nr:1-deoxy-D-xylulose-5-phosphate synthase [Roseburia sp.]